MLRSFFFQTARDKEFIQRLETRKVNQKCFFSFHPTKLSELNIIQDCESFVRFLPRSRINYALMLRFILKER